MGFKVICYNLLIILFFAISSSSIGGGSDPKESDTELIKRMFLQAGNHILQNGRIISNPVVRPIPVDQIQLPSLQMDEGSVDKVEHISQGDILIRIDDKKRLGRARSKRKIIAEIDSSGVPNRWPRGVVPYEFQTDIDSRVMQKVLKAMEHWHQRTCIRFEPYNSQRHWDIASKIAIQDSGSGCASYVGYRPGSDGSVFLSPVYLPHQCPLGSAIHELGHVIGYYHEMSRTDRDNNIILSFDLMARSERSQYDFMPDPMPGYYGQPYDLYSIMHYYGTDVMTARDSRRVFLMGQRVALSFLDSKLANLGYHCGDHCSTKPICENEGYVNQNCLCSCPDGFGGDRCNQLRGTKVPSRLLPPTTSTPANTSTTTQAPSVGNAKWLEWTTWSNCSESCGTGVRVRTRLCSSATGNNSPDPCSALGGDSFEMESCQSFSCNQSTILASCTFDLVNETCPWKNENGWQLGRGMQANKTGPMGDHTRGDGNYIYVAGNTTRLNALYKFRLGPIRYLNSIRDYCLQFWYSMHGQGVGGLTVLYNRPNNDQRDLFTFGWRDQGPDWKSMKRTITTDEDFELIFSYQAGWNQYSDIAIDDISVMNGACASNGQSERRRKRQQSDSTDCTHIFDLTSINQTVLLASTNYPNLYPANQQCYYYIRGPISSKISLDFTDFNVPTVTTNQCDDTVEIRYYHLGQPGPRYCGTGASGGNLNFVSTKNYILVVFQSDKNYAGRGFLAQAKLVS